MVWGNQKYKTIILFCIKHGNGMGMLNVPNLSDSLVVGQCSGWPFCLVSSYLMVVDWWGSEDDKGMPLTLPQLQNMPLVLPPQQNMTPDQ